MEIGTDFAEDNLGETKFSVANLCNKFTELAEVDFGTEFAEETLGETEFVAANLGNKFTELAELVDIGTDFAETNLSDTEFGAANLGNKFTELVEVDSRTEFAEANLGVDIEMEFAAAKLYKFIELAEVTIGTEIFQS